MAEVYTLADLQHWTAQPPAWTEHERPILSVIGDPVAHSLSPQMMNPALQAAGIAGRYIRLHLLEDEFEEALQLMPALGFMGTNVTIPHKFRALRAASEVDPLAEKLGAVNTLVMRAGRLLGYNSDGPGFLNSLREAFGVEARDLRIMILGAGGGAGRAVAIQCALAGCPRLALVNRTRDKVEAVVAELTPLVADASRFVPLAWETEVLAKELDQIDLIVNATSLGMKPTDAKLLPDQLFQPRHLAYDMVYRPAETKFLAAAKAAGARASNGLSMLLHQGAISFDKWFQRSPDMEAMRRGLAATLQQ